MEKNLWGGVFSDVKMDKKIKKFIDSFSFDRIMYKENFDITLSHAIALSKIKIIEKDDIKKIIKFKKKILEDVAKSKDDEFEDVHSAIEFFITKIVGEETGYNLRLGRSRNEEVITTTNLWILRNSNELNNVFKEVSSSMIECAENNFGKIIPLFTHTRQAQPILFSHLILSHHEGFIRCLERFRDCLKRLDVCHLGSGAGAGTGIELDVELMAKLLGFSRISQNSIDSTSRRDMLSELIFCFSTISSLFSKISDDLILLSSEKFGFVQISDKLCTGSSMMPQKKNPDTLEVIRSKFAKFIGYLNSMITLEKGLISGYSKDLQEDKRILFQAFQEILDTSAVIVEVFKNIEAKESEIQNYTLATDLAEKLVLLKNIPYRKSHKLVGEKLKQGEKIEDIDFKESLKIKKTPQSTNPKSVKKQIQSHSQRASSIFREIEKILEKFQESEFARRVQGYIR